DWLRNQHYRRLPSGRCLCRPHPQGREARRSSRSATDQVRAGHQSENCEGAWPNSAAVPTRPRRRGHRVKRREFIAALGSAAVSPVVARAQAVPVVGFLSSLSSSYIARMSPAVRQGLSETGYIEGQNVAVDYRSAEGQYDRLPGLVTDLVNRNVSVILAVGG